MAEYHFRPLTEADRPLFDTWLAQPHIGGWWADAETEWQLLAEEFGKGSTDMRIVELNGAPFAYVQDYDAHHWPMPQYNDLPRRTRAVDTFLGAPEFLGRGHASGYLRQRGDELLTAYSMIAVDPAADNLRALATYERAGFKRRRTCPCEDGDMVTVMTRTLS